VCPNWCSVAFNLAFGVPYYLLKGALGKGKIILKIIAKRFGE